MMHRWISICFLLTAALAFGQNPAPKTEPAAKAPPTAASKAATAKTEAPVSVPRAPIKGRVVTEDGEPVRGTTVIAAPVGRSMGNRGSFNGPLGMNGISQATTDEEGNFIIQALPPAAYALMSSAPGYVSVPADEKSGANLHYPGEAVTLTLVKGGIITGKITTATGEPLTGITVNVERVSNAAGEEDANPTPVAFARPWRTDDQGVYRIYGLVPGNYIVQAGGRGNNFGPPNFNANSNEDAPTFYPSAVREGAVPVPVYAGIEAAGIDIRYRGERGRAVSGKVTLAKTAAGAAPADNGFAMTQIYLTVAGSDTVISTTRQIGGGGPGPGFRGPANGGQANDGYAFYGIPDGEYDVYARRTGMDADWMSAVRRIVVRGADVAGVELVLNPLMALSGRIVLEKQNAEAAPACRTGRPFAMTETLLRLERDESKPATAGQTGARMTPPDQQGNFVLRGLNAGHYRFDVEFPATHWYLRTLQFEKPAASVPPANRTAAAGSAANLVRDGLNLKQGEKTAPVLVTLKEGAGAMRGQVSAKDKQTILLIPAEKEAADDLLRYDQTVTGKDGAFRFTHLAPGKYWLVKQPFAESPKPLAWDNAKRLAMRRLAETSGSVVEAVACQETKAPALN